MNPTMIKKPAIKIIGIEVRTNNRDELSGNGKIGSQWGKFYQEQIGSKIPNQIRPEEIFAIYMDYESDVNGDYSFVIGKEVATFEAVPNGMVAKTLPASKYAVFTSRKGPMPNIVIELWQHIWGLKPGTIGGDRAYLADFEIYDFRSQDPSHAQVDVFVSLR